VGVLGPGMLAGSCLTLPGWLRPSAGGLGGLLLFGAGVPGVGQGVAGVVAGAPADRAAASDGHGWPGPASGAAAGTAGPPRGQSVSSGTPRVP